MQFQGSRSKGVPPDSRDCQGHRAVCFTQLTPLRGSQTLQHLGQASWGLSKSTLQIRGIGRALPGKRGVLAPGRLLLFQEQNHICESKSPGWVETAAESGLCQLLSISKLRPPARPPSPAKAFDPPQLHKCLMSLSGQK